MPSPSLFSTLLLIKLILSPGLVKDGKITFALKRKATLVEGWLLLANGSFMATHGAVLKDLSGP